LEAPGELPSTIALAITNKALTLLDFETSYTVPALLHKAMAMVPG